MVNDPFEYGKGPNVTPQEQSEFRKELVNFLDHQFDAGIESIELTFKNPFLFGYTGARPKSVNQYDFEDLGQDRYRITQNKLTESEASGYSKFPLALEHDIPRKKKFIETILKLERGELFPATADTILRNLEIPRHHYQHLLDAAYDKIKKVKEVEEALAAEKAKNSPALKVKVTLDTGEIHESLAYKRLKELSIPKLHSPGPGYGSSLNFGKIEEHLMSQLTMSPEILTPSTEAYTPSAAAAQVAHEEFNSTLTEIGKGLNAVSKAAIASGTTMTQVVGAMNQLGNLFNTPVQFVKELNQELVKEGIHIGIDPASGESESAIAMQMVMGATGLSEEGVRKILAKDDIPLVYDDRNEVYASPKRVLDLED